LACLGPWLAGGEAPWAQVEPEGELRVEPREVVLTGKAAQHGILVSWATSGGRARDVSAQARYSFTAPTIAAVSAGGRLTALSDGQTELRIAFQGLSAGIPVRVEGATQNEGPSFRHEINPIFTRMGCNQGACHGKQGGQNGFKLSLRGFAPEEDYDHLILESQGRRVNHSAPESSLFLSKPMGRLPHKGGVLLQEDSRAVGRLVRWIEAGTPGLSAADPGLEKIEVLGGGRTLKVRQEQPLLVLAHFSDGRVRDVTWISQFFSNDPSVLEISPEGRVRPRREGVATVRAHYQDRVAIAAFTIPHERPVDPSLYASRETDLDGPVFEMLEAMRIPPSGRCADEEYLRRATLDTLGTLPTEEEARSFLADGAPDKRARLARELLARPEFVDYWALELGDLLQNRRERDHDVRGTKGVRSFHEWIRQEIAQNRPWNEMVREILLATGDTSTQPQIGYFVVMIGETRQPEYSDISVSAAQSFLGTRILCAKCHNHPEEKYTQDDYYQFAAFFSRISLDRQAPQKGPTALAVGGPEDRSQRKQIDDLMKQAAKLRSTLPEKSDPDAQKIRKEIEQKEKQAEDALRRLEAARREPVLISQPRTGRRLPPRPLDRSAVSVAAGDDPRKALVDWMVAPENEYFSGSIVNRIWKHFMGVGLVEPVDDLRPSNPPLNAPLLACLRDGFVRHGFDLRWLMGQILTSRAYQLSSATRPENESDRRFYSHYYARRLSAEVLLDAISQVTGVPDPFPGYPLGIRAIQLPDPGLDSYFLSLFGRSSRVTACACEREGEVTLPQLLHMQNGDSVLQKIRAPEGRLARLTKSGRPDAASIESLFLMTLSRRPRPEELAQVERQLGGPDPAEAWHDLVWALLNAKEFVFNH
jgi:hypothetical protein